MKNTYSNKYVIGKTPVYIRVNYIVKVSDYDSSFLDKLRYGFGKRKSYKLWIQKISAKLFYNLKDNQNVEFKNRLAFCKKFINKMDSFLDHFDDVDAAIIINNQLKYLIDEMNKKIKIKDLNKDFDVEV